MRLDEGVIRELHWHKEAEWAYVLDGEVRVTALDYEGGNFIDDLKKGDIWVRIYSLTFRAIFSIFSNAKIGKLFSISPAACLIPCKA